MKMLKWISPLILGIIFASICLADEANQNGQTQSLPDTLDLQYKYSINESVRYAVNQHITGTQTYPGKDPSNIDVELSAIIKLECIQTYNDGSWDLKVSMENATMKSNGKLVDDYSAAKDVYIVPFNKHGSMNLVGLDFGSLEFMPFILVLPDKPIASAESWSVDVPLGTLIARAHMEYRAVSVNDGKYTIKLIITTKTGLKDGGNPESSKDNLEEGSAEIIFDQNAGKLISAKGILNSTVSTLVSDVPKNNKEKLSADNILTTKLSCRYTLDMINSESQQKALKGNNADQS